MTQKIAYFLALLFAVLTFAPAAAHLLELMNKMTLGQADYFVVQQIYRGWALLGIVVIGGLVSSLALTVVLRKRQGPFLWALGAFLCALASHLVFWIWTYPANRATENWTRVPANWEELRLQWEYGHAGGAVLGLFAVVALICSLLAALADTERKLSG
ncbi:MAG: hypothetical protein ACREDZ_12375 [Kiloniellales bacterium]